MPWFTYKAIPYEHLIDKKSGIKIDRSMITVEFIDGAKDAVVEGNINQEDAQLAIFELMRSGLYPISVVPLTDFKEIATASRVDNLRKFRNQLRKRIT